jgi:hypothetical protein
LAAGAARTWADTAKTAKKNTNRGTVELPPLRPGKTLFEGETIDLFEGETIDLFEGETIDGTHPRSLHYSITQVGPRYCRKNRNLTILR